MTTQSAALTRNQASRCLVWAAQGLLAAYAVQGAAILLTPHASASASLLAFSEVVAEQGFLPLMAVASLQVAAALAPDNASLVHRCRRQREARVALSLLLVLLPLQLLAGWGELQATGQQRSAGIDGRLRVVRQAILNAPSLEALERELAVLQAPPLPTGLQEQPLPRIRRQLLTSLQLAEQRQRRTAAPHEGQPIAMLLPRLLRTCLLTAVYALGLMATLPSMRARLTRLGSRPPRPWWPEGGPGGKAEVENYLEQLSKANATASKPPERTASSPSAGAAPKPGQP